MKKVRPVFRILAGVIALAAGLSFFSPVGFIEKLLAMLFIAEFGSVALRGKSLIYKNKG